jgi:hypothetical protein
MNQFYAMKSTVSVPSSLISPTHSTDNSNTFLHAPTPTRARAPGFPSKIQSNQTYFPIVIILKATDQIIATGNVFIEKKFLRGLGTVGHIEDIAVDKTQQGKKLGLRIIQSLTGISEALGCYKTILNCSNDNIRKFGFSKVLKLLMTHSLISFLRKMWICEKGE